MHTKSFWLFIAFFCLGLNAAEPSAHRATTSHLSEAESTSSGTPEPEKPNFLLATRSKSTVTPPSPKSSLTRAYAAPHTVLAALVNA